MENKIQSLSYDQLKQFCREKKIKGFSKHTNKTKLRNFILENISHENIPQEEKDVINTEPYNIENENNEVQSINKTDNSEVLEQLLARMSPRRPLKKLIEKNVSEQVEIFCGKIDILDTEYLIFNISIDIFLNNQKSILLFEKDKQEIFIKTQDNKLFRFLPFKTSNASWETDRFGILHMKIPQDTTTYMFWEDIIDDYILISIVGFENNNQNHFLDKDGSNNGNKLNEFKYKNIDIDFLLFNFRNNKLYNKSKPYQLEINNHFNDFENERYDLYKNYFNKKIGLFQEKLLFHGTSKENLQSILTNGLTMTNNTKHGKVHGNGVYFTDKLDFALKYPKTSTIERYVIVCKVGVNNIIEGRKAIENFPTKSNSHIKYDTGVDNLTTPVQFVKKDTEQYKIIGYFKIIISSTNISQKYNSTTQLNNPMRVPVPSLVYMGTKITNNTNFNMYIFWDKYNVYHDYPKMNHNYSNIQECVLMTKNKDGLKTGNTEALKSQKGHRFIIGFYDTNANIKYNNNFNIYCIYEVGKAKKITDNSESFVIQ